MCIRDRLFTADDRTPLEPQFTPYGEAIRKLSLQADTAVSVSYPEPEDGKGLYVQAAIDHDKITLLFWNYQQMGRHAVAARLELKNVPAEWQAAIAQLPTTIVLAPNSIRQLRCV